jgi:hypothetical protein
MPPRLAVFQGQAKTAGASLQVVNVAISVYYPASKQWSEVFFPNKKLTMMNAV